MYEKGKYSDAEQKMIDMWHEDWKVLVGWMGEERQVEIPYPVFHRTATKELIEHFAASADWWNPLWQKEEYARNTRWGGVIAPPMYYEVISHSGPRAFFLKVTPEVGKRGFSYVTSFREFFQPIHVGDTFKVFIGSPKLEDVTGPEKQPDRRFKISDSLFFENQRGEITSTFYRSGITVIIPNEAKSFVDDRIPFVKQKYYTDEELNAIYAMEDAEVIRGKEVRWFEDVNVGDELTHIVKGPLTPWDAVIDIQGMGVANLPVRECRKQTPFRMRRDPETNIIHKSAEAHFESHMATLQPIDLAHYTNSFQPISVENFLGRLVTNWMGDDAFLRKIRWIRVCNIAMGDTIFGRGHVLRKYTEDGEHLVDIVVEIETSRGYVSTFGVITVSLLAKEDVFEANRPPIFRPVSTENRPVYGSEAIYSQDKHMSSGIKVGDRVRIKNRDDWYLPGGYNLSGVEGTVYDIFDDPEEYILVNLDEDKTGIDTRVPLGFRVDAVDIL